MKERLTKWFPEQTLQIVFGNVTIYVMMNSTQTQIEPDFYTYSCIAPSTLSNRGASGLGLSNFNCNHAFLYLEEEFKEYFSLYPRHVISIDMSDCKTWGVYRRHSYFYFTVLGI